MGKSTEQERTAPRPFNQFLLEQRRGGLHEELTETFAELARNVMENGKQGTVTIQLKVKPIGDGQVQVTDVVTAKIPEAEKAASIFFTDEHGNVTRQDPRQTEMPLKGIEGGGEAVAVGE